MLQRAQSQFSRIGHQKEQFNGLKCKTESTTACFPAGKSCVFTVSGNFEILLTMNGLVHFLNTFGKTLVTCVSMFAPFSKWGKIQHVLILPVTKHES